jgi:putative ABC transport system ATP-binding protein
MSGAPPHHEHAAERTRTAAVVEQASMLQLRDVVRHYRGNGEDVRAVDGVSLTAEAGEMLALHGPSGSGKTTLLLLMAALLGPEQGVVRYQGRDLATLGDEQSSEYRLRELGFVHQSPQLMPRVSAVENAAVKLLLGGVGMREAQTRAIPWLERLGLGQRLDYTPEQLSGGERQRVAIARALVGEPRLILADEPTANLDSTRSREVVELLHEVAHERDVGVILVTHDTDAAAIADRCCTLRDGRLQDGPDNEAPRELPATRVPTARPGLHPRAEARTP